MPRVKPRRGKARVKVTKSGKKVSYGQAGKASDGGPRVRPGTKKGDAYCARSYGQMKKTPQGRDETQIRPSGCRERLGNASGKSRGDSMRHVEEIIEELSGRGSRAAGTPMNELFWSSMARGLASGTSGWGRLFADIRGWTKGGGDNAEKAEERISDAEAAALVRAVLGAEDE